MTPAAAAVIQRLEFVYPHAQYTTMPAAQAATAQKSTVNDTLAIELPPSSIGAAPAQTTLTPGQIGDATHLVLEHLDYRRPCDADDIETQIAGLVSRRLIDPAHAAAVDRAAIAWLAASDLGMLLHAAADQLMREIAFAAVPPGASFDAVMTRGRIDLVVPVAGGLALVDYKTDRVPAAAVPQRAAQYMPQVQTYREALTRIAGKKVAAVHLVFLHPRIIFSIV